MSTIILLQPLKHLQKKKKIMEKLQSFSNFHFEILYEFF